MRIRGGCYCKNVRYEVLGDVLKSGVCHCHDCQHLTGGSSWPFIVVPSDALIISGHCKEFSRTGASAKKVHVGFCPNYGSTLFGRSELWPHIHTISASTIDTPYQFSPDKHVWTVEAPDWVTFAPELPKFERNPNT